MIYLFRLDLLLLYFPPATLMVYAAVMLLARKREQRTLCALGWLTLAITPALVWAAVRGPILLFPVRMWELLGGWSVDALLAAAGSEPKSAWPDGLGHFYTHFFVVVVQTTALIGVLLAWRRKEEWRDPVALGIGAALLLNAFLYESAYR